MALGDIYQKASLVQIPSGYKAADAELYSVVPNTTAGDFTVSVDADATRVNKDGLVESVAANQARLDYNPSNPQDPHLLLEPQRTNDTTHSEDFTQTSYWNNVIDVVATTNQTTAPDGSNTGNKIQANSGTNFKILRKGAFTIPSGITMSMFVKRGNHDYILFKAQGDYNFNLNTLTWGGSYSNVGYELYPNDWVRLYATTSSSVLSYFGIYLTDSNFNQSWNATGNEFVYVWGAQYETGSYPTSLIPTSGSAVTRTVDNVHLLNQTFITNYPFTVYANAKIDAVGNAIFSLNNTSNSSYYLVFNLGSGSQVAVFRRNPSASNSDFWNFSYTVGDTIKVAVAFISATAYKLYINGTEIADRTSGTSIPFNHDDISLGQFRITGDTGTRNSVNEFMLFNEALTDAELQTLTT